MDWDWKDFAWDSLELEEKEDSSSLAGLVGCSGIGGQKNRGGLAVDLKLGRVSDLEERSVDGLKDRGASTTTVRSSPSGPLKRNRVLSGTQNVSCLVDGCKSDLSICRDYHRRHRVCELHSKTPVVIVGGKEQRFCQQCSRFHSLGEFDEVKRSCRKRLDGHNMRRRKSQPEPLYLSSEKLLSNYKGPRMLQFSNPHIYATTLRSSTWPGIAGDGQRPLNSFAFIYNEGNKMFSFLQENGPRVGNQAAPEASLYLQAPPNSNNIASTESGRGCHNILSDGLTQSIDLGCALYLLSTHQTQTPAIGLNPLVQSSASHPIKFLGSEQQFHGVGVSQHSRSHAVNDKSAGIVLVPNANEYCNGGSQGALDGLLESEASRAPPFWWE
ncbi:hypothetical protein I3843_03G053900 [Carya illinoinensis]|nr:hypothetical protein I3843_03G053900 [Carya illinoinensis]